MPQRTTAERPMTENQRRIYETWASYPEQFGKLSRVAAELGISRKRVSQALAVVRTKMQGVAT